MGSFLEISKRLFCLHGHGLLLVIRLHKSRGLKHNGQRQGCFSAIRRMSQVFHKYFTSHHLQFALHTLHYCKQMNGFCTGNTNYPGELKSVLERSVII